jgi:hypothetical protein
MVGRVAKVKMTFFYCNGGWQSSGPGKVGGNGGVDLMLRF